jgi:hypothetical protein
MVQESRAILPSCPSWCVELHATVEADDVRVHIGEPVHLSDGVAARLCMSVDALGEVEDGPFVLVGEEEYTLEEAIALGGALIAMAEHAAAQVGPVIGMG